MSFVRPTTAETLRAAGACDGQIAVVRATWGDGPIPLTAATISRAAKLGLDLDWWATRWLPAPLSTEYERQVVRLWAEYERPSHCQRPPRSLQYRRQAALLLIRLLGLAAEES